VLSAAVLLSGVLVRSVSIPGTQMDVKLATQVGRPYDAAAISEDVHALWQMGRFSDIRAEIEEDGGGVDVVFRVVMEPRYALRDVRFKPHAFGLQVTIPPGALLTRVQAAQAAASAREELTRRGYLDARIGWRLAPATHRRYDLVLTIDPGRQGRTPKPPRVPDAPPAICGRLFEERRQAERKGILDFSASLDESGALGIERGRPYRMRRLTFYGNHHYSDALIRSHFLVDEGAALDPSLLRRSLSRLNRAGLFEPLDERRVHVATDDRTGAADVTVYLTERKRRSWNLSGPIPVSASIAGRVISTYSLSFHVLAFSSILKLTAGRRLLPVLSAERAFTPGEGWRSGIAYAPQLGWRATVLGYASTQFQQRMLARLVGTRQPDLEIATSGQTLVCRYPTPRFAAVRTGASLVLRFAGQVGGLP